MLLKWRRNTGNIQRYKNVPGTSLFDNFTLQPQHIAIKHLSCQVLSSESQRFPLKKIGEVINVLAQMTHDLSTTWKLIKSSYAYIQNKLRTLTNLQLHRK